MAQTVLQRVLEEIQTLDRDELQSVERAVRERLAPPAGEDPDERVLQALLQAGLITEIKRPDPAATEDAPPVPIQGPPLSETILEERR